MITIFFLNDQQVIFYDFGSLHENMKYQLNDQYRKKIRNKNRMVIFWTTAFDISLSFLQNLFTHRFTWRVRHTNWSYTTNWPTFHTFFHIFFHFSDFWRVKIKNLRTFQYQIYSYSYTRWIIYNTPIVIISKSYLYSPLLMICASKSKKFCLYFVS